MSKHAVAELPRGRPKSRAKQQQILEAAVDLFLDRGFDGTSMDEIAERAGVSKQTVYSHFRGKEELFSFCIEHKCVSYELSAEFFDDERPVAEVLGEVSQRFSQMLLAPEVVRVKRILCASAEHSPQLSELFYRAGPKKMVQILSDYLARQHARGRLIVPRPETAARQLLFMLHGDAHNRALMNVRETPGEPDTEAYVDACVALFLRGYAATDGAARAAGTAGKH